MVTSIEIQNISVTIHGQSHYGFGSVELINNNKSNIFGGIICVTTNINKVVNDATRLDFFLYMGFIIPLPRFLVNSRSDSLFETV